jgi:hypothetical protein
MINMRNITQEVNMSRDIMIDRMSPQALKALAKIGTTWIDIVGSHGNKVSRSVLRKAREMQIPWSVNKITNNGQGRSGIINTFVTTFVQQELMTENNEGHFTKYMLTEIGHEVIDAMLYSCMRCGNDRICTHCVDGFQCQNGERVICGHTDRDQCNYCNGTGIRDSGNQCRTCTTNCENCDEKRHRSCYYCHGNQKCIYCKGINFEVMDIMNNIVEIK